MYFKKWPYGIVPEEKVSTWADRHNLFGQIKDLFKNFAEKRISFVQPLWGYLGAGKTHTLKHFKFLLEDRQNLIFIYSKFPMQAKNFYELYRDGFVQSLDFGMFVKKCSNLWKNLMVDKEEEEAFLWILDRIANKSYDFAQVIYNLAKLWSFSPVEALRHPYFGLSRMWLQGAKLSSRDMRKIGVTKDIRNDQDAVLSFAGIFRLLTSEEAGVKVVANVWMLDDSQALLGKELVQHGLRRAIDECPRNVLILISFAMTDPEKIRIGLIDELKTVCASSILEVPPLTADEAFEYIVDLINLEEFKVPNTDRFYPYTKEVIAEIISKMKDNGIDLLPRSMNYCFGHLTNEAERNALERISTTFVTGFFENKCCPPCPLFPE